MPFDTVIFSGEGPHADPWHLLPESSAKLAELITDLDVADVEPLYVHEEGGVAQPPVWARTVGDSRIVYNALGHDLRSYESPAHVDLLRRIVAWLRHDV